MRLGANERPRDGTKAGLLPQGRLRLATPPTARFRSTECGASFGVLPEFLGVAEMAL
jgi:hypothetical protein